MSSSVLTVFDQQLLALSSKGDLSVPVDIFDTYTHTHTSTYAHPSHMRPVHQPSLPSREMRAIASGHYKVARKTFQHTLSSLKDNMLV